MLTQAQYEIERAIVDRANAYAKRTMAARSKRCNYLTIDDCQHEDYKACDNAMRGRVELFELNRDKPERFVAYMNGDMSQAQTWIGDTLSTRCVVWNKRRPARVSHTSIHIWSVNVLTIWGDWYCGTSLGGGLYVKLRKMKHKPRYV